MISCLCVILTVSAGCSSLKTDGSVWSPLKPRSDRKVNSVTAKPVRMAVVGKTLYTNNRARLPSKASAVDSSSTTHKAIQSKPTVNWSSTVTTSQTHSMLTAATPALTRNLSSPARHFSDTSATQTLALPTVFGFHGKKSEEFVNRSR